jgi:hypothetical protein|tara:strand:+ start:400 stop:609 length:210 start_codon:yes stop_codon:yes gene_type:complete
MKLTNKQREMLKEYDWDLIINKVDGKEQNCSWVSFSADDGVVFGEIAEQFGLTGDKGSIKLLVVATSED